MSKLWDAIDWLREHDKPMVRIFQEDIRKVLREGTFLDPLTCERIVQNIQRLHVNGKFVELDAVEQFLFACEISDTLILGYMWNAINLTATSLERVDNVPVA